MRRAAAAETCTASLLLVLPLRPWTRSLKYSNLPPVAPSSLHRTPPLPRSSRAPRFQIVNECPLPVRVKLAYSLAEGETGEDCAINTWFAQDHR